MYHQISGAEYVKRKLGITDEEILSGIRYHTTGKENMSVFDMVIYLADLTSAERSYNDVEYVRTLADKSLFEAMLYALKFTITDLVKDRKLYIPTPLTAIIGRSVK